MSIVTWRKEFCPTPAEDMKDASTMEAVQHSLRKWEGLRERSLRKHGLVPISSNSWQVRDVNTQARHTVASAKQCALCRKFLGSRCVGCPLNEMGGRADIKEGCSSLYSKWSHHNDPEPMITALQHAKQRLDPLRQLHELTLLEAMEKARVVLKEIGTVGGKYGHQFGDIVYDSTQAEAGLRFAMKRLGDAGQPGS